MDRRRSADALAEGSALVAEFKEWRDGLFPLSKLRFPRLASSNGAVEAIERLKTERLLVAVLGRSAWPELRACQGRNEDDTSCGAAALSWADQPYCEYDADQDDVALDTRRAFAWWCITHGHKDLVEEWRLRPAKPGALAAPTGGSQVATQQPSRSAPGTPSLPVAQAGPARPAPARQDQDDDPFLRPAPARAHGDWVERMVDGLIAAGPQISGPTELCLVIGTTLGVDETLTYRALSVLSSAGLLKTTPRLVAVNAFALAHYRSKALSMVRAAMPRAQGASR